MSTAQPCAGSLTSPRPTVADPATTAPAPVKDSGWTVVEDGDRAVVAFRMGGRQVGPLQTAAGLLPPTGRTVQLRVVDVLTLDGGRIADVFVVADELGALAALDAVRLVPAG